MSFALDPRLAADTFEVGDLALSRLLLMNDRRYPWLILAPRGENLREIADLDAARRAALIEEIVHQEKARQCELADLERVRGEARIEREIHASQLVPDGGAGRPSLRAIVAAMSASVERAPIGPAGAPPPKARIGTCSRVWS